MSPGCFCQVPAWLIPLLLPTLLLGPASLSPHSGHVPVAISLLLVYGCTTGLSLAAWLASSQSCACGAVTSEMLLQLVSVLHVGASRAVSVRGASGLAERQACHQAGDGAVSVSSLPAGRTRGLRSLRTGRCASTTWRCTTGPCTSASAARPRAASRDTRGCTSWVRRPRRTASPPGFLLCLAGCGHGSTPQPWCLLQLQGSDSTSLSLRRESEVHSTAPTAAVHGV